MRTLAKSLLVWTLTLLLGFEPALLAAGKDANAELKSFLEYSQITQRQMTLKEFYYRNMAYLPGSLRAQLEGIVKENPNYMLPKFDINKVMGPNGEEQFQLQAVKDGQSESLTLVASQDVFIKVNGRNLSWDDMNDARLVMTKVGVPFGDVNKHFPARAIASSGGILTAKQINRMGPEQRKLYFKQLQDLFESMEAVENAVAGKGKTSALDTDKFKVIAQLVAGEFARAGGGDDGKDCLAAGHPAKVVNGSCGSDGKGGAANEYRKKPNGDMCKIHQFACGGVLYPESSECVAAGPFSTRDCNAAFKGKDFPELAGESRDKLDELRINGLKRGDELQAVCAAANYSASGLKKDQASTCENFKKRYDLVKSWDCNLTEFKNTHVQLCKDPIFHDPKPPIEQNPGQCPPPPVAPPKGSMPPPCGEQNGPPQNGTIPGGGQNSGSIYCDSLPLSMSFSKECENGTTEVGSCVDRKEVAQSNPIPYVCKCPSGDVIGKMKCEKAKSGSGEETDKKSKKSSVSKIPWLAIGIGVGALFLVHWLTKRAAKESFAQIQPATDTTPPVTTPPLPTTLTVPAPISPLKSNGVM